VDQNGDRQHTTMMANLDSTYGYHGGSGLASISYPSTMSFITPAAGPSYNYSYNSMEQLSGMTSGSTTLVSNVTYNAANQLLTMNYGVSESRGYNSLNQLTTLNNGTENLTYTYPTGTNNGKISSMYNAVSGETVTYTYDSLNRIATASGSIQQVVQWDQSYVFDPFGNLLQKNIAGGSSGQPSTQVTVNNQNQITSVYGLSYDANGNAGGGYDAENRLVGGPGMYYGYDAQNKRIWSWTGAVDTYGNTTNYTVNVYSPSGQKLGAYVIAPGFIDNSQTNWVTVPTMQVTLSAGDGYFGARRLATMDQLGSVGNYFPWGEDKGGTSPQDTWNFGTYWRDSVSGLDYANNRYYNNAYGSFITPDPYQASGGPSSPQSWNRYAYVIADPVNANDPDGLMRLDLDPPALRDISGTLDGSATRTPPSPDQQPPSRPGAPRHPARDPFTVQFVGATSATNYPYLIGCGGAPYGAFVTETFQIDMNGQPLAVPGLTVEEMISNSVVTVAGTSYPGGDSGLWTPTTIPGPTTTNANGQFIDSPFGGCGPTPAQYTFNQTYRFQYNGHWYNLSPTFSFTWTIGLGNITVTSTSGINFTVSR
jgi:RHS repeat-associated protein